MKNICYDPKLDSEIFTTEQAAEYLGYTYKYMRQVLCEGGLASYDNAGKTRLFLKAELDKYIGARDGKRPSKTGLPETSEKIEAAVSVQGALTELGRHKIKDFSWDQLPKLHSRLKADYGKDVEFSVKLRNPEGGTWDIRYFAPNLVDKTIDAVKAKLKRK
ncbi:MAG: excisionase family DNA-binding protein [Elusimicrobiales bacterium]